MTIQEAVTVCDEMKPNQYPYGLKLTWLSDVERKVYDMMVKRVHDNIIYQKFKEDTDSDRELMASEGYTMLYVYYLMAMIDFSNAEMERYQNDMVMFNTEFENFTNYWYSAHRQLTEGKLTRL